MTRLGVKWAQVPEGSSPPKLPCFLPTLAQAEQEQTSPKAKKKNQPQTHELLPRPVPRRGRTWAPCTAGQPAPHPHSCPARQTDTHRAPGGWQLMAGKRSCFACHAVGSLEHRNTFVFIPVIIR